MPVKIDTNFLEEIINHNRHYHEQGVVATYIPALGSANREDIGIYINTVDGKSFFAGCYNKKFTMQSISKILSLILALMDHGEEAVFSRVGVQPVNEAFNAITKKPYNPMLNIGAILVTSMIKGENPDEKFNRLLTFARELSGNNNLAINNEVYLSEKATGDMNRALAYFLKASNILHENVEETLDVYFKQCSIEVSCKDIANMGAVLAKGGVLPGSGRRVLPEKIIPRILAIITMCGMYNEAGKFLVDVGIPAKSGVSGGILGAVPNRMGIGIYNPALNNKGNSIVGIKILEELSKKLNLSMFSQAAS